MIAPRRRLVPVLASLLLGLCALAAEPAPVAVEPSELARRTDLIGRPISVDDRLTYFLFHQGQGFDELVLKRTPVPFRVPPALRPKSQPKAAAVRVRGTLREERGRMVCDVSAMEFFPADLERLEKGVAALPPNDADARRAWARWAERRGREFGDAELQKRAQLLEGESLRIEAGRRTDDPGADIYELARQARGRQVPEPEPSALAHRAFQAQLASARTVEDLKGLRERVEAFFPAARTPSNSKRGADLSRWEAPFANDPAAAYRSAPEGVRSALDRRLWADVVQRLVELQTLENPEEALPLAEEAVRLLPDRAPAAHRLLEGALASATRDLSRLRRKDVERLAGLYREPLGKPEAARELARRWLDDQRQRRLSPTDAEGRVSLAAQYEAMLGDRAAAAELLRSAWKIDPQSSEVADAFRRRGFRRVGDDWVEPNRPAAVADAGAPDEAPAVAAPSRRDSLRGSTPQDVRERLGGRPDRRAFSATQGQLIEQWIYYGAKQNQYVNFLHRPGSPVPRVVAYYSLPRTSEDPASPR